MASLTRQKLIKLARLLWLLGASASAPAPALTLALALALALFSRILKLVKRSHKVLSLLLCLAPSRHLCPWSFGLGPLASRNLWPPPARMFECFIITFYVPSLCVYKMPTGAIHRLARTLTKNRNKKQDNNYISTKD